MNVNSFNKLEDVIPFCKKAIGTSSVDFWKNYFNDNGFVYFLMENNIIVYIGASQNSFRIGQHQKTKDFDEVYFYECQNYWHLEKELIKKFNTKYNRCKTAIFYHPLKQTQ
jgi:hypothetical protein